MSSDPYLDTVDELGAEERARKERLAKLKLVNGTELFKTHYEEPKYLWQGVLPDAGLAICAASKASGKTLLLLQLADAIARGREFLGIPTTESKVLFIELELSQRRTEQRLSKMGIVPGANIDFSFEWQTGAEGLQALADAIEAQGYRLVVVDVLQLLWPIEADANSYQDVYSVLAPLRQLANDLGVMIMLVTHRRKMETADYLDGVMGSVAMQANADVLLTLIRNRGEENAVLFIDGNDIEAQKLALDFCTDPLGYRLSTASPEELRQTPERRRLIEYLREHGGHGRTSEIATALGIDDSTVSRLLRRLADNGLIVRTQYGEYTLLQKGIQTVQSVQT
jgi:RecA-family ATPase